MAFIEDDFNRTNATGWGTASVAGSWSYGADGGTNNTTLVTITSNKGRVTGGSGASTPASFASLSQQNDINIQFKWTPQSNVNGVVFIGAKATGSGNRNGVGMHIEGMSTNNILLTDNGTVKATGSFSFTAGTQYSFELIIYSDYSSDLYVWATSGSKPGTPTLSNGSGFTPSASGTDFQMGYSANDAGAMDFDDVVVSEAPAATAVKDIIGMGIIAFAR